MISTILAVNTLLVCSNMAITDDLEDYIELVYGKEYPYILDYKYINPIGNFHIYKTKMYKPEQIEITKKDYKNDMYFATKVMDILARIPYVVIQNDPKELDTIGGNCQAKTLKAKDYFDSYGLPNKVIWNEDKTHMYNEVKLDGKWYLFDLTYYKFEEI